MKISKELKNVINIFNDLENLVPYGLLFVTNFPELPAPGLPVPRHPGWKWLDFPYNEIDGMSPLFRGLQLLVRRLYCRLTYRIFDKIPRLALIRIYMMPLDSPFVDLTNWYREKYYRFKRPIAWLDKRCLMILENLLTITDFSTTAFNLNSKDDMLKYICENHIALVNFMCDCPDLNTISSAEMNYHLRRLISSKSFRQYVDKNKGSNLPLQKRLSNLYLNITSPSTDLNSIDDEKFLLVSDRIKNDEIQGFKSKLYNFQKRSVLKMFEKESSQLYILMPNLLVINKNSKKKYYFDIKKLMPILNPQMYLPPRGGLLAENMGLGKTCICLALICISKFEISEIPLVKGNTIIPKQTKVISLFDTCINSISQNSISWKEYYDDLPSHIVKRLEANVGYFDKKELSLANRTTRSSKHDNPGTLRRFYLTSATLVVLPDNLFHQWRVEILKHIEKDYLKILEIPTLKQMNLLKNIQPSDVNKYDILLISNSVFSKQFEITDSILKHIYWKRLVIDEGHSMNSKSSRAVLLTKDLMYERMWVISGTPTSGLTNLHVENETNEYTVQKSFDPKQDLIRLGTMVSNFFKIEPWCSSKKLWLESIIKPFEENEFNIELQMSQLLEQLIIRHNINDVENDIKLPQLHHKPVFLKPSFYDKISINLFISVLATNAITSDRKGVDYMFDPSNKNDLRRLVTNLQKGTFYWTGFSINDVENLLNICVYSLRENSGIYSDEDKKTLNKAIFISKLALSNMRWRSVTTVHEMGYFVKNLPNIVADNYSLVDYKKDISVFGYPHLISIQKFYYKNRMIKTITELNSKIIKTSVEFWRYYWNSIKSNKAKSKITNRPLSNKEEYKDFELSDIQVIGKTPEWVDSFNPKLEEKLLYEESQESSINRSKQNITSPPSFVNKENNIRSKLRNSTIIGTLSTKLNYLTMRLLENQLNGIKSIVFYEFENSAYYLTEFLDLLGMNYLMYSPYIKVSDRSNNLAQFDRWDPAKNEGEGISLIMDLKLASHGLTIIAATHVFFINPVWNQSIEAQAIKRSHRIGQLNEVFVETLILENTLEEQMYNMRSDVKDFNNIELIDHTKIKDYILQFPFLKLYEDGLFTEEYSNLNVPSGVSGDLTNMKNGDDDDDDTSGVTLRPISGEFNAKTKYRNWNLPLFTKKNLDKIVTNENKLKKRRYDDINEIEKEESLKNGKIVEEDKTVRLLEKLRHKRKCKRIVRFNV